MAAGSVEFDDIYRMGGEVSSDDLIICFGSKWKEGELAGNLKGSTYQRYAFCVAHSLGIRAGVLFKEIKDHYFILAWKLEVCL